MQYIQFQGQIASQVPTPPVGSVNLFIDANNKNFGTTNENGDVTILGGLTTLTKAELDDLISTSGLTSGHFYQVTDASTSLYGGTNIIIQAVANNKIAKKATGLFYNPKYSEYNVWDRRFRLEFDTLSGSFDPNEYIILHSSETDNTTYGHITGTNGNSHMVISLNNINDTFFENSDNLIGLTIMGDDTGETCNVTGLNFTSQYAINDKVIWGNKVWRNLTGFVGIEAESYLALNEDWELVTYNLTDYDLVANEIEYDYENDFISYRNDGNNFVRQDYELISNWWGSNNNQIAYFPWGHLSVFGVKLTNSYQGGFVNLHNSSEIINVIVDGAGEFSFDYCGRGLSLYDIKIENWGSFNNNLFPYGFEIQGLKLGTYAAFNYNTFSDNDYGYSTINDIEIGVSSEINSCQFYSNTSIQNVNLGNNSTINNLRFYQNSRMFDSTIGGTNAILSNIMLLDGSEIKYLNLRDNAKIQFGTLDISSCLKRIDMGPETNISFFSLGLNSFIRQITMNSRSYVNNLTIGDYSNYQNINFGPYSNMFNINVGNNCNFQNITLNAVSDIQYIFMEEGSYFSDMVFSSSSSCGGISLEPNSSMSTFDVGAGGGFGEITIMSGATMENFSIGTGSGFGGFNVSPNIIVNNFEIGVDVSFSYNFTGNTTNKTINQSLNNLLSDAIGIGNTTPSELPFIDTTPSELPFIDTNRTLQVIDVTDVDYGPVMFYLPDGNFEGQILEFILKGNGVYDNNYSNSPQGIQVWIGNARVANGTLSSNGTPFWFNWYPFAVPNNPSWRSYAKCIWTNGAWTTDNDLFD